VAARPIGGDFLTLARAELILPLPFVDESTQFRLTGFLDAGNVFASLDEFDAGELRYSTGFSTIWFAGIGIITTSWGFPLNDKDDDEVQNFQFTIGTTF
jgi:outer membrane protein insertion porin family